MEKLVICVVNVILFKKYSLRSIFLIILSICILTFLKSNVIFSISNLDIIINSDLFNISGILAGFVFTGLSFIVVSDSDMIDNLKITGNFNVIKNIYMNSILSFVMFMLFYLIKTIILVSNRYFIGKIYFALLFALFVFGCITFIICLFILNKRINENK